MASLEERVAFLEGRVEEHSQLLHGIRESITSLETHLDRRLTAGVRGAGRSTIRGLRSELQVGHRASGRHGARDDGRARGGAADAVTDATNPVHG